MNKKNEKNTKNDKKKSAVWHFTKNLPVESDVLGSYTGTAINLNAPICEEDLYPVQDADDL